MTGAMAAVAPADASSRESPATGWAEYLTRFHAERPGITERILGRRRSGGTDPYRWCAEPFDQRRGPVLDIACGSAPLAAHLAEWIGTDDSAAELGATTNRAAGASDGRLPRGCPVATNATDRRREGCGYTH